MDCRDAVERLSPFVDDELDPVASLEVARHLETCPECAAAAERLRALGGRLRHDATYHRAPGTLRARVTRDARAALAGRAHARPTILPLRALGAAAAVLVVAGGAWLVTTLPRERREEALVREVVSGHVRSLMANHLEDVASTDRHTVKPWFAGRLDFSPPVTDLAAQGYPLAGGRLDYLQGRAVAALVYLRHQHVINVFVWPATGARESIEPAVTQQGYHVIHGERAGMAYWIVSDLNAEELAAFARVLASSMPQP